MSIHITVICSLHTNIELIPHFIDHYKKIGVTDFVFGVSGGKENPTYNEMLQYVDSNIRVCASYNDLFSPDMDAWFANRVRLEMSPNDWYIPADLDELHVTPGYDDMHSLIRDVSMSNSDFVWGQMVDRVTQDGSIPLHITPTPTIWEQFPVEMNLTGALLKAWDFKVTLAKQSIVVTSGHHYTENYNGVGVKFEKPSFTHHFKWFGNLLEKEEAKLVQYKTLGVTHYTENQILIDHLKSHNGKLF